MTRTISGKNLKIYFVDGEDENMPRFVVDGTEVTGDHQSEKPASSDFKMTVLPALINDAGSIFNIAAGDIGSTSLIMSLAGSVRSNHYPLPAWHLLYVVRGLMYYYWRPFQKTSPIEASPPVKRVRCKPGDMMWTPPMVEHATYFPEETVLVAINGRARDHASH